jgi:hypothetical protein
LGFANSIPAFITANGSPWEILPPAIHQATLDEIEKRFATNTWRYELFNGLVDAAGRLRSAGCKWIYLNGSYVTGKPQPGDFDVCWDPADTDSDRPDPVFFDFTNKRAAQKAVFKGEFFPPCQSATPRVIPSSSSFNSIASPAGKRGLFPFFSQQVLFFSERQTHDFQ